MVESTDTEWASGIKVMAVLMNVPSEFLDFVLGFVADLIETIIQLVPEVAIRMLEVDLALNQRPKNLRVTALAPRKCRAAPRGTKRCVECIMRTMCRGLQGTVCLRIDLKIEH
jgi:hypothetical protein